MKIQTQARLLVAGIVLAPLLILLANMVYRAYFVEADASDLPTYEEFYALMDQNLSAHDWDSIIRAVERSRNIGEVAVFRDDYLVLYSTIPAFSPGAFASREGVLSLVDAGNEFNDYIFVSQNLGESRMYILNIAMPQIARPRWPPFFIPAFFFVIGIIILTIFAICMSIGIARTITNSVQVLENATRRIAEGELDLFIDVKGSNEITSLANSLNKMRIALKEEELRRSRFIMGITHDLKTPLALIKGYAEAIEDGVIEDTLSHQGAAEIIAAKADQLEGMINDLINFVRMETAEWRDQAVDTKAAAFFSNLALIVGKDVDLLHHEFVADIVLPEDLSIPMNENLVLRALENLVNNGIRHTPPGTVIRFSAKMSNKTVVVTVSDNGLGIEPEALPHIFEMFYRGSSSRREQGMGLGLAVVKWVVNYHLWSIAVSSEKDQGTCFTITIPLV